MHRPEPGEPFSTDSTGREALDRGQWYLDDADLRADRLRCARLLREYNATAPDAEDDRARLLQTLLGRAGETITVEPRFWCSYGAKIRIGDRSFINTDAVLMDDAPITLGADVRLGPRCQLLTALHPMDDHHRRREGWERALPIKLGDNVWLGAGVIVCPGVTIGADAVVGAGAVVLHDVAPGSFAAGNPARIIRTLG